MKAGKADPTQTFGEGNKHKTESSNIVASKLDIGSGKQYETGFIGVQKIDMYTLIYCTKKRKCYLG